MSGDIDLKQLQRQIMMAREDMETWPEWIREAAQMGAALPPDVMSIADEMDRLRELAESEGTRAVDCLRRARKAEGLLREVLEALPGLQAPNCLGMDLYQRIGAVVAPNALPVSGEHEQTTKARREPSA